MTSAKPRGRLPTNGSPGAVHLFSEQVHPSISFKEVEDPASTSTVGPSTVTTRGTCGYTTRRQRGPQGWQQLLGSKSLCKEDLSGCGFTSFVSNGNFVDGLANGHDSTTGYSAIITNGGSTASRRGFSSAASTWTTRSSNPSGPDDWKTRERCHSQEGR